MITKRHIYGPLERIESAIKQFVSLAKDAEENGHLGAAKKMLEIVQRDLSNAANDLQYVMEIAD